MQNHSTIALTGQSGTSYTFDVYGLDKLGNFEAIPVAYAFLRDNKSIIDSDVLYIGATDNAKNRLTSNHEKLECVEDNDGRYGGPYIAIHGTNTPFTVESDLLGNYNPPCNETN
ncbi:MAG: hypothetical protein OXG05_13825 [Gammaproteobacteria bacterium]|nr:hypothetical protein [Gammaproteobacteria bacterium]